MAKVAGVGRPYLYHNFRGEIEKERHNNSRLNEQINGLLVPNRSTNEYKHFESLLRNKIKRLESDLKELRIERDKLLIELEREAIHWKFRTNIPKKNKGFDKINP